MTEPEKKTDGKVDRYKEYKEFKWQDVEQMRKGPMDDSLRGCTDILCCIIFCVFLVGMAIVLILGFSQGNPSLVLYPYDEDGNQCGMMGLQKYPYLYLYQVTSNIKDFNLTQIAQGICLSSCPANYTTPLPCWPTKGNPNCTISKSDFYNSTTFIGRFCIPNPFNVTNVTLPSNTITINGTVYIPYNSTNSTANANSLFYSKIINTDKLISWLSDLSLTYPILLSSLGWSLLIAIIFLFLVRCCAAFIIYSTILLVLCSLAGLGYVFQQRYDYYKQLNDSTYENTMLVLCAICYSLAGLWLIYILFMCNRIRLAVALTETTAKYMHDTCLIFLVPVFFFIFTGLFYAYWVALSVFLYSCGTVETTNTFVATITWNSTTRFAWWFHLFALFYINAFINAYSQFVLASSACIWYFSQGRETGFESPISKSFYRGVRYHLGSLAFGSLIVAIIRFIMAFLEYIKQKVDTSGNNKIGKCYKCLLCCCQCCLDCLARIMEFINRHAYIQIALTGDNFCVAASKGFGLIIRNLGRFSALLLIGGFFSIFGTLFIASVSGLIGYLLITRIEVYSSQLNSPVLPVFVMVLVGYIVGIIFMNVFGMSADSLMHCFLLDEELNDKIPRHTPDELKKFMDNEKDERKTD